MRYDASDLSKTFDRGTVSWARDCVAAGSVHVLAAASVGAATDAVSGFVSDRRGRVRVIARAERDGRNGVRLSGDCSCAARRNCHHVVAVLWAAIAPPDPDALRPLPPQEPRPPVQPPSRSRSYEQSAEQAEAERIYSRWAEQLSAALEAKDPSGERRPSTSCLLYLLDVADASTRLGRRARLHVHTVAAHFTKNGGYGRSGTFRGLSGGKTPALVTRADRLNLAWLQTAQDTAWTSQFRSPCELRPLEGAEVLPRLVATGRCHWRSKGAPPLRPGEPRRAALEWEIDDEGNQRPVLRCDAGEAIILPLDPPWYVDPDLALCGPLETDVAPDVVAALLAAPPLGPEQADSLRDTIESRHAERGIPLPARIGSTAVEETHPAVPHLLLHVAHHPAPGDPRSEQREPMARLSFGYGDLRVGAFDPRRTIRRLKGGELHRLRRDERAERTAIRRLDELGIYPLHDFSDLEPRDNAAGEFLLGVDAEDLHQELVRLSLEELPRLRAEGWQVELAPDFPYRFADGEATWYADIRGGGTANDWFDLDLGIEIEGRRHGLLPLLLNLLRAPGLPVAPEQLAALPEDHAFIVRLEDGRLFSLPAARVRAIVGTLVELYGGATEKDGALRLGGWDAPRLAELDEAMGGGVLAWSGGEALRELGRQLRGFEGVRDVEPPCEFRGTLRDYQRQGLSWLQFLREHRVAGVLADDMGLGKTIQVLAHLLAEKAGGRADLPSLVVAPTSLMPNWRREAERFAPSLSVLTLHGASRKRQFERIAEHDLVLTTYPLLPRDEAVLRSQEFHLLILDEAQFVKNARTKSARIAGELSARHRLCLTGTPMENHLGELWSLFQFVMPGFLGDEKWFRRIFRVPIERERSDTRRRQLAARLRPFLLRRTKEQVAAELPPKTEMTQVVELEPDQRDLYESIRLAMHERVRREIARKGLERSSIVILDALLKLRQVCCDPRLLKLQEAKRVKGSAKLTALSEMLGRLIEEGRRILLFSQFTSMLALIEEQLRSAGRPYLKLTGETRDRETPVRRFQAGEVPLFLISLKAGGTGLNLPAADTVIHYDPWWNPAVEDQATDRAHRIGQHKPVFVYKLIVAGSVEEKILALQARKRELAQGVYGEPSGRGLPLSAEDLEALFQPLG